MNAATSWQIQLTARAVLFRGMAVISVARGPGEPGPYTALGVHVGPQRLPVPSHQGEELSQGSGARAVAAVPVRDLEQDGPLPAEHPVRGAQSVLRVVDAGGFRGRPVELDHLEVLS